MPELSPAVWVLLAPLSKPVFGAHAPLLLVAPVPVTRLHSVRALKQPFPENSPSWQGAGNGVSRLPVSCLPTPRDNAASMEVLRAVHSGFMGQEGGQLDLAIHGGSEAGPAVHRRAPVHGDHGGSVATQAQAALQNLLIPTQL